MKKFPEWQTPPVHPAAQKLPMMSDAELDELAADIKANGLLDPIILWRDNHEEVSGSEGPFPIYLLDGRNRLAALERLGITDPRQAPSGRKTTNKVVIVDALQMSTGVSLGRGTATSEWKTEVDPTVYVLSANVRRRHLTSAQKRQAIADYITADPQASDREVARTLGVSTPAVGRVRSDPNVTKLQTDHLPIERAKAALRADPTLTQRPLKAIAKVGTNTAVKARKELEMAGEIQPLARKSTPRAMPKAKPNPTPAAGSAAAPTTVMLRSLRKALIAFAEDQVGKLVDIRYASTEDVAEYVAAVNQVASKLTAAARRHVKDADKEVQSK